MISLLKIQKWMAENNKDVLLINRTDEFLSEYIAPYAERLQWLTKFSGSAGRAIIEKDKAYIYVDGRYTNCLLYTSPSPRDLSTSRMPSSA